jgi:hypothetical protein
MSDLLSDPRGKDLLAAQPEVISDLATMFHGVATTAESTAGGLRGASGDANWTGSAANAFRQGLGQVPDQLGKVSSSYHEAAAALSGFEAEVYSLKPAFQSIVSQLGPAQAQLANAQSSLTSAQNSLGQAQSSAMAKTMENPLKPPTTVPLSSPLHDAVNTATGVVSSAQEQISSLTSRGFNLLDEFDSARGAAQGRVSTAAHVPPHPGFWDSVFGGIGHFLAGVGSFIIKPVEDLPGAIAAVASDPGNLGNWGKLAEDVAGTAMLAATILAPFAAPELIAADAATDGAAAGAEGASEAAADVAEEGASKGLSLQDVVDGANTTSRWAARTAGTLDAADDTEHGDFGEAALDGGLAWLPDSTEPSNMIGEGDQAVEAAKGTSEAWEDLQKTVGKLPDSDLKSALNEATTEGKETAEQAVAQAQHNSDTTGQILDYGADKAKEVGKDWVDGKIGVAH